VLTAVVLDRILRSLGASLGWRIFNAAWCGAILYSTLSTKQHVFSDIAVGSAMGLIAAQFFSSSRLNVPD
jgi:membrane-associated phospholipid phosphatase